MTFASVAIAALALAAPAAARRTRPSGSVPPPPPTNTIPSGSVNESHTSSSTSTASCSAEVKASTTSTAKSAFVDLIAEATKDFCFVNNYWATDNVNTATAVDRQRQDGNIKAIANLLLESKLECDTTGKYALACASSWAGAYSFAAAGVELYASAWADGSNRLSHCNCAVDVFASADALTSSWAELWVSIYQDLDDRVCAQSYDGTADSVKSQININCVGNLVLKYWVKAVAKVVVKGECQPDEYLACRACCKDPQGDYYANCDLQACETTCRKDEYARLTATATAAITFEESSNFDCTKTVDYGTYWGSFAPKEHYKYVYGAKEAYATCEAYAQSGAWTQAASDQAVIIKGIWENTCNPLDWAPNGHAEFDETVTKWARAYVKVLAIAHTNCSASGGDIEYDGGCALATSYSRAFAQACSEAFVDSFVDFTYGKNASCECDIGVSALVTSITHEIDIISAFYETAVEARSCSPDVSGTPDYSYIGQECWASSLADMVARSMASVSLEGSCIPTSTDKVAYCEEQACRAYETYTEDWEVCLTECTKNTDAAVTAALETSATIDITTTEYCGAVGGKPRVGETYLTALNGYANSTQTP